MDIDDIYGGDWLRAKYLPAGIDVPVTIDHISTDELEDNKTGKRKKQIVLGFEGKDRRLGLNKTNANMIAEMHGRNTDLWMGKTIKLYVTKTEAFGEITDCIRVRYEEGVTAPQSPPQPPAPADPQWTSMGGGPPVDAPAAPTPPAAPGGKHTPIDPDDIPF